MRKFSQGFSLIELMISVGIVGVLAAIAIPSYTSYVNKARTTDLLTAIHTGKLIVDEYIQSTGATDCTNMSGQVGGVVSVPYSSINIGQVYIDATNSDGYGNCTVIVGSNGTISGKFGGGGQAVEVLAIPTFNLDGSLTWNLYSNGKSDSPPGIPVYPGFKFPKGGGGGEPL